MFFTHLTNRQIAEFANRVAKDDIPTIKTDNNISPNYLIVAFEYSASILHITDFECLDVTTGKMYSSSWRQFVIKQLDKLDPSKKLSDEYIDNLHDFLEQDTIYGPIK